MTELCRYNVKHSTQSSAARARARTSAFDMIGRLRAPASRVKLRARPEHGARTRSFHSFSGKRVDSGRLSGGCLFKI